MSGKAYNWVYFFFLQRDGPITGRNRGLQVGELISGSLLYQTSLTRCRLLPPLRIKAL